MARFPEPDSDDEAPEERAVCCDSGVCSPCIQSRGALPGLHEDLQRKGFEGWVADASTWSIVDGAMRGTGGSSRLAYTKPAEDLEWRARRSVSGGSPISA